MNLCGTDWFTDRLVKVRNSLNTVILFILNTVKPVLSGHLKIDKTKILMTNGS